MIDKTETNDSSDITISENMTTTSANLQITPFVPGESIWVRWLQRLEGALAIMKITEETEKAQYLLHYIGDAAYDALCDTLGTENVDKQTYAQLKEKLKSLYAPEALEIAENFKFNCRKQQAGESVQDFATALQKLSATCNFGDFAQTALRNQFVYGLGNVRIQGRLLETKDLTFTKALTTAVLMETCERESSQLREGQSTSVNYIHGFKKNFRNSTKKNKQSQQQTKKSSSKKDNQCYRCGSTDHLANSQKCKVSKSTVCNFCKKLGHLERVCLQKSRSTVIKELDAQDECERDLDEICIIEKSCDVEHKCDREKFYTELKVNDRVVTFELDSGAAVTLMCESQAKQLFPNLHLQQSTLYLVSYCTTTIPVLGYATVTVVYENTEFRLNLYITKISRAPICGRE